MAIKISLLEKIKRIGRSVLYRPMPVAIIVSLALTSWVGWQAYQLAFDRPLPADKISAHRLRANSGQLLKITTTITSYQAPAEPGPTPPGLFAPAPK